MTPPDGPGETPAHPSAPPDTPPSAPPAVSSSAPPAPLPPVAAGGGPRAWGRDLRLGVRFAVTGGREGWTRTALVALGVGLGVALLFIASSVPHLIDERARRADARFAGTHALFAPADAPGATVGRSDTTLVLGDATTEYRGDTVNGRLLRPDGARPPLPPGLSRLPGPGEIMVSPALRALLDSPRGELLKERLDRRIVGTIGAAGLVDPGELYYYAGSDTLTEATGGWRADGFGAPSPDDPADPLLVPLITLVCVVLLVPVAIFIATAVRFGGERRDRGLAALRLVGADIRMTRRIAAGEALFGSGLGLLTGLGLFLAARPLAGGVRLWGVSAFPGDLVPAPALAALIVVAVPVAAVVVTLVALRSVTIEPLGVVRESLAPRRRLWWRLLMPAAGVGLLQLIGSVGDVGHGADPYPLALGATLMLVGLATLLPWLVEAVVRGLSRGPVPWQLATRRLQLDSGSAARAVGGITVAVAGAIALQMVFGGMHAEFVEVTGRNPTRADISVRADYSSAGLTRRMAEDFRSTEGVTRVIATAEDYVIRPGAVSEGVQPTTSVTVGDCATLRELARLPSCADGDTFVSHLPHDKEQNDWTDRTARPGKPVDLNTSSVNDGSKPVLWTLPASTPTVEARKDSLGREAHGILATPGALDPGRLAVGSTGAALRLDPGVPDAEEHLRNAAARIDPTLRVTTFRSVERDKRYASLQTGLLAGGTATMALIAASLLISQIEQLRERRRALSVLVALGTPRSTLAWSVLWQTAVPVVLGTALAIAGGLTLGALILDMLGKPLADGWVFLPFAGTGMAVVTLVTLVSMPPLWRMMRPDGLRSE
ncbi:FtsX-like permease family protein [Streptomyces sp. NPDC091212]|uniref:FtsX-like permease family protein n=1 Tax=Streptomyces sp. NPDC091212 TaxID=3155191 RepID=UPI00343FF22C